MSGCADKRPPIETRSKILAKDGIKVLALCPSWTSTPMAEQAGTPYSEDQMISTSDIVETIRWFQKLSPAVAIREIFLDCYADVR